MGMPEPGYPRAGSRRQCEAVFWSTSLGLPLPLLLGISGHEASSQRKLGGSKCTGFSWSAKHSSLALLLHMSKLPFRPADVFPPPSCSQMQTCLPAIRGEKLAENERNSFFNLWRKKLWERVRER